MGKTELTEAQIEAIQANGVDLETLDLTEVPADEVGEQEEEHDGDDE